VPARHHTSHATSKSRKFPRIDYHQHASAPTSTAGPISAFHATVRICITSIIHPLAITTSRKYLESPLGHHRASRDHDDGRRPNLVFSHVAERCD
jgi:hypothetical protein